MIIEQSHTTPTTDAVLVDASIPIAMLDISRASWYKLVASGKAPKPIKLGRVSRWNRAELEQWIAAGCPPRSRWETMRAKK